MTQPCGNGTFGNNLPATSGVTYFGFLVNNESVAVCGGVATQWNYCFYGNTSASINGNSSATFQIYRRQSGYNNYTVVPNSVTILNLNAIMNVNNFTCGAVSPTTSFSVLPGDIIAVCTSSKQSLGVVGNGGLNKNTLLRGDFGKCGMPFDPTDNQVVSQRKTFI